MSFIKLPKEFESMRKEVEKAAIKAGLDFFPVQFYKLDSQEFNEVIANNGFPDRYPHWSFGMKYNRWSKQLGYGFGKVYELVLNTNPAIAYLLSHNIPIQHKMVMAHVYAHVDFFKNNMSFAKTNRNMVNTMADHAAVVEKYYEKYGIEKVERFIDACLSIENLVDPFFNQIKRNKKKEGEKEEQEKKEKPSIKVKPYLEDYVKDLLNPQKKKKEEITEPYLRDGDRDIMQFMIDYAVHLEDWQKNLLSIIRDESCYFLPQGRTKIMNEGWATFWHSRLMSKKGLAGDSGIFEFADAHSKVTRNLKPSKGQFNFNLNPYALGFALFLDIKERWDKGRYGHAYESEKSFEKKRKWDTGEMNGMDKIFEVRTYKTDVEFIREFLTNEFIKKYAFFIYDNVEFRGTDYIRIKSKQAEKIRASLLYSLTNFGEPIIKAIDANFNNNGSLLLKHDHIGEDLHPDYAASTLKNVYSIWQRPVFLMTKINGEVKAYKSDVAEKKK